MYWVYVCIYLVTEYVHICTWYVPVHTIIHKYLNAEPCITGFRGAIHDASMLESDVQQPSAVPGVSIPAGLALILWCLEYTLGHTWDYGEAPPAGQGPTGSRPIGWAIKLSGCQVTAVISAAQQVCHTVLPAAGQYDFDDYCLPGQDWSGQLLENRNEGTTASHMTDKY